MAVGQMLKDSFCPIVFLLNVYYDYTTKVSHPYKIGLFQI